MLGQPGQGSRIWKRVARAIQRQKDKCVCSCQGCAALTHRDFLRRPRGLQVSRERKAAAPRPGSEITAASLAEGPRTGSKVRCRRPWCCERSQQRSSFAALQQVHNTTAARTRKNLSTPEEEHTSGKATLSSYKSEVGGSERQLSLPALIFSSGYGAGADALPPNRA